MAVTIPPAGRLLLLSPALSATIGVRLVVIEQEGGLVAVYQRPVIFLLATKLRPASAFYQLAVNILRVAGLQAELASYQRTNIFLLAAKLRPAPAFYQLAVNILRVAGLQAELALCQQIITFLLAAELNPASAF